MEMVRLTFKPDNFYGSWNFKEIILPNGEVVPHIHSCDSKDNWQFFSGNLLKTNVYYDDCSLNTITGDWYITSDLQQLYIEGDNLYKIKRLTQTEMQLEAYSPDNELEFTRILKKKLN
jgi:hypothetical protein